MTESFWYVVNVVKILGKVRPNRFYSNNGIGMEFHRTTLTRRRPPMQEVGFNSILVVASFCSHQLPRQDASNINPKAEERVT